MRSRPRLSSRVGLTCPVSGWYHSPVSNAARLILAGAAILALAGCRGNRPPTIELLSAEPDSVPRGGWSALACRAVDPEGGPAVVTWQARAGTVDPATGDSVRYYAPNADAVDTVSVAVTDPEGVAAESSLVIVVAEGLCGGRPEVLAASSAELMVADSGSVYYVDLDGSNSTIRHVRWDGTDSGTTAVRDGEVALLVQNELDLFVLEEKQAEKGTRQRLVRIPKDGSMPTELIELGKEDSAVTALAASGDRLFLAWNDGPALLARVSSLPVAGGALAGHDSAASGAADRTEFGPLVYEAAQLCYVMSSLEPGRVAIRRLDPATGAVAVLVDAGFLSPGTIDRSDGLAVVGDSIFWSEYQQGRIGMVARDGSGPQYVVPAGGPADNVGALAAVRGYTGTRLFWLVPNDLRGLILSTGDVLRDMEHGEGPVYGLAANDWFLFFTRSDGTSDRLYRLIVP